MLLLVSVRNISALFIKQLSHHNSYYFLNINFIYNISLNIFFSQGGMKDRINEVGIDVYFPKVVKYETFENHSKTLFSKSLYKS